MQSTTRIYYVGKTMNPSKPISVFLTSITFIFIGSITSSALASTPPVAVATQQAFQQDVPVTFEYVGQIAGSKEVEIRSRISGIIEQRLYTEGEAVKAGELLFKIEQAPLLADLAQAKASLASAKASQASAEAQLNKAERELKRTRPLAKKNLVSPNELDNAVSDVEIAAAQVLVAKARVQQAEANLTRTNIDFEYTLVKSPIDGVAGLALQSEGSLTQAGSNSLLTTVVQLDPAYANFGVSELEQLTLKNDIASGKLIVPETGFHVELLSANGEIIANNGSLNFQDYKVDNTTGNFAMRATVANPDKRLSPGQFVKVRLVGALRPQTFVVPQRAVLDGPEGKYLYVVAEGQEGGSVAMKKPVVVGEWVELEGDLAKGWIIQEGLSPGDKVIVDGSARIFFPGMPVQEAPPEK